MAEYAEGGRVGLGTPQANPTVEPEFARLLPDDVAVHVVRLTSRAAAANERLVDYLENLDDTLARFDTLRLDAFAFACTGSSYLLGRRREREIVAAIEDRRGHPVHTAADAIHRSLSEIGAERVAIIAPYPPDLAVAARRFWEGLGYRVVDLVGVELAGEDTRAIYDLGSGDALAALRSVVEAPVDAFVFTGTGMPTLAAIGAATELTPKPVLSSNSCLAALLGRAGG